MLDLRRPDPRSRLLLLVLLPPDAVDSRSGLLLGLLLTGVGLGLNASFNLRPVEPRSLIVDAEFCSQTSDVEAFLDLMSSKKETGPSVDIGCRLRSLSEYLGRDSETVSVGGGFEASC